MAVAVVNVVASTVTSTIEAAEAKGAEAAAAKQPPKTATQSSHAPYSTQQAIAPQTS